MLVLYDLSNDKIISFDDFVEVKCFENAIGIVDWSNNSNVYKHTIVQWKYPIIEYSKYFYSKVFILTHAFNQNNIIIWKTARLFTMYYKL